eukprot:5705963-Alexandrium_andersonii.AAC.1
MKETRHRPESHSDRYLRGILIFHTHTQCAAPLGRPEGHSDRSLRGILTVHPPTAQPLLGGQRAIMVVICEVS